jgi:sec-independent protein translocase protein TatC
MSFLEHLEELRVRLIRSMVAVLVGMIVCWSFHAQILEFLLAPLYDAWSRVDGLPNIDQVLNFSSLVEPFSASMKIAAIAGLFVAAPFVLYQLWCFIAPGLYSHERKLAMPFVLASTLLFVGGSIMAYMVVLPVGFEFFLDFASGRETVVVSSKIAVGQLNEPAEEVASPAPSSSNSNSGPRAPAPSTQQDQTAWYETILVRFTKSNCGTLHGVMPALRRGPLTVEFEWHSATCGSLQVPLHLKVGRSELNPSWSAPRTTRPGYQALRAVFAQDFEAGSTIEAVVLTNEKERKLMPVLMLSDYLTFAMRLLLAFGLIFELPVIVCFLALAGIVHHKQLLKFGRWFVILAVIIGALLTPPDVLTQLMLAVPLIVLYYVSVLIAYFVQPKQ